MLRLENLEVGDYTFTLKVTDTAGQTSTADVHVFVKPGKSHQSSILCLIDKTMAFTYFIIGITIYKNDNSKRLHK